MLSRARHTLAGVKYLIRFCTSRNEDLPEARRRMVLSARPSVPRKGSPTRVRRAAPHRLQDAQRVRREMKHHGGVTSLPLLVTSSNRFEAGIDDGVEGLTEDTSVFFVACDLACAVKCEMYYK